MADDDDVGQCYNCGEPGPWIILVGGEDEPPRREWACEAHARGHQRWALVTPAETPAAP